MSAPYMKLYVADYLGDTIHLDTREHGAYLLLMMAMWRAGGRLPADDARLAKIARCAPAEWDEIKGSVLPFFQRRGGVLTQKRLSLELAKVEDTSKARSQAGKAGARRKLNKNNDDQQAFAFDETSNCQHNQISESELEEPPLSPPQGGTSRKKPAKAIPDGFPTPELIAEGQAKARAAGANVDAARQAERFRNWALGKDARYVDWAATWRNWINRTIDEAPKNPLMAEAQARPAPATAEAEVWRKRVRDFLGPDRYWNRYDWGPPPNQPESRCPREIWDELRGADNLLPFTRPGRAAS